MLASRGVLYYGAGPSTYKVPREGGAATTLATFAACRASRATALADGEDCVYQTDPLLQFNTRARTGQLLFDALAVVEDEVVWADHAAITAKIVGLRAQTTSRQVLFSAGSNTVTGFAVTGRSVYLGEGDDLEPGPMANTVQIAPFTAVDDGADTPTPTVVATGQTRASSFVADATHIFWVTRAPSTTPGAPDDRAIVSLAK